MPEEGFHSDINRQARLAEQTLMALLEGVGFSIAGGNRGAPATEALNLNFILPGSEPSAFACVAEVFRAELISC